MGSPFLSPEHLHVMVNHVPLIGLAATLIPLVYALVRRENHTLRVAFAMSLLFGLSTAAVMFTGDEAAEEADHGGRLGALLDAPGEKWMHEHEHQAENAALVVYVAAASGLLGLVSLWKFPRASFLLGLLCLALNVASLVVLARTAQTGGMIRHPEFRESTR